MLVVVGVVVVVGVGEVRDFIVIVAIANEHLAMKVGLIKIKL